MRRSCACCVLVLLFRLSGVAVGVRVLSGAESDSDTAFTCPEQCLECGAVQDAHSEVQSWRCVLKSNHSGLPSNCAEPKRLAFAIPMIASQCEIPKQNPNGVAEPEAEDRLSETGQLRANVETPDEKLVLATLRGDGPNWPPSAKFRCCCDAKGLNACVGDHTPKFRWVQSHANVPPAMVPNVTDMSVTEYGCPAYFSDYGLSGQLCECSELCAASRTPVMMPRGLPTDFRALQMASLAGGVYYWESPIAGWTLVKDWDVSLSGDDDRVGIYTRRFSAEGPTTCALVFGGTSSLGDVKADLDLPTVDFCGYPEVHGGFAKKSRLFSEGERYHEFFNYLTDPVKCGGGTIAVGHSMGGAMASLLAACANKEHAADPSTHPLKFDEIYTMAQPSISKHVIKNALSKDGSGCFDGIRFFNQDKHLEDPIPAIAGEVGFKHPALTEARIWSTATDAATYVVKKCSVSNSESLQDPEYSFFSSEFSDLAMHFMGKYIPRMKLAGPPNV